MKTHLITEEPPSSVPAAPPSQFRVLYRQFLFRMMDLELLSSDAQGDMNRLFGQFGALLVFIGSGFMLAVMGAGNGRMKRAELLIHAWGLEHVLIATTLLVVGLFAVLSWDSTFPDRSDLLVLAPLPVRARTLFRAKVAASAAALSLAVVALNGLSSLLWPLTLAPTGNLLEMFFSPAIYRTFAAWWITLMSAGVFLFGCILCVQGLAAQLPRRIFLRVSALLQIAAFCLLVSVYCLQPWLATPEALAAAQNQRALAWLPSYWFLAMFQQLNGSMHPVLVPLARRAWISLAASILGAAAACLFAYLRTLRKIVEEPDIVSRARRGAWLPSFGGLFETAVVQFALRTLLRSRQHRMILAFYLGIGFALVILGGPPSQFRADPTGTAMRVDSLIMMSCWIAGVRVVFSRPLELRANWIFRITGAPGGIRCLSASRRSLLVLSVAPVLATAASVFFWFRPWSDAAAHVVVLALVGLIVADVCLHGFRKIPFTCSYLPGKSKFHLAFLAAVALIWVIVLGTKIETWALQVPARYIGTLAVLLAAWGSSRLWGTHSIESQPQFEETQPPAVLTLNIQRDGAPLR